MIFAADSQGTSGHFNEIAMTLSFSKMWKSLFPVKIATI